MTSSPQRLGAASGALPRPIARLQTPRRVAGFGLALVALPALTAVLERSSERFALGSVLLLYILTVVVVAAVGGIWPGVLAAAFSVLAANWFFTPPYRTLIVEGRDSVVELVVFGFVALIVSVTVDYAARDRARAARSRMEADLIAQVAIRPLDDLSLPEILEQVRTTFGMTSAALVHHGRSGGSSVVAAVGPVPEMADDLCIAASGELELRANGPAVSGEDLALLERLATAAARAWESQHLAAHADQLTEVDRVRSALLAAIGHDLRTPLSGLKAAVSSLRQDDVTWSDEERNELLAAIEGSADRLSRLIGDILDLTRIEVGAVVSRPSEVAVDEVASLAVLDLPTRAVTMAIPDSLPLVEADAALLERVVANLVDNAVRHSPPGNPAEIRAEVGAGSVQLSVADHGPGVPTDLWSTMFAPFQRLGDRSSGAGAGLGLAIVHGFCMAMGVDVIPSETPGGGLTMTIHLPLAAQ